jgi:hypothetical protein
MGDPWNLDRHIGGGPLDLDDAAVERVLINDAGACVASYPGLAEITLGAPGVVVITLAADATEDLPVGRYTDALRVTTANGNRDTLWRACLLVDARPPWPPAPPPILAGVSTVAASPAIGAPSLLSQTP